MKHDLDLLKYIWDNRNLNNKAYQYLFHICIDTIITKKTKDCVLFDTVRIIC